MSFIDDVHKKVAAVCPIEGVDAGEDIPKSEWKIWFNDDASIEQKVAAQAIINNYDISAYKAEAAAEQALVTQYENDQSRKDMVNRLKTASPTQIDTWLTNNVTNLAQARNVLGIVLKLMRNKL